jgi:predicted amidohydrolase YtcJ
MMAVNRDIGAGDLDADQAVDLETWLQLWTAGSAAAGGQQDERGMLKPGHRADLVVLDGDPPVVEQTWRDGKLVWSRPQGAR